MLLKNSILFDLNTDKTPIWFMRQAGRYLSEYKKVRANFKNFLDFCYTPEACCEVTLQPIERFDFDLSIIFSDILVIPDALGQTVNFIEQKGPVLKEFSKQYIYNELNNEKLNNVYEAIKLTRVNLPKSKPLIGFVGAPFTLACYMTGIKKDEYRQTKELLYNEPKIFDQLIERLITETSNHLINQIKAGCNIVKIFDSWAGILHGEFLRKYVLDIHNQIIAKVRDFDSTIPIICFPRNIGLNYIFYINHVKADIVALDQFVERKFILSNITNKDIILQGNLDPILLNNENNFLEGEVKKILEDFKEHKLIFNLGHGIMPQAKIENVYKVINLIRNR